jgi:hypothetical protein
MNAGELRAALEGVADDTPVIGLFDMRFGYGTRPRVEFVPDPSAHPDRDVIWLASPGDEDDPVVVFDVDN